MIVKFSGHHNLKNFEIKNWNVYIKKIKKCILRQFEIQYMHFIKFYYFNSLIFLYGVEKLYIWYIYTNWYFDFCWKIFKIIYLSWEMYFFFQNILKMIKLGKFAELVSLLMHLLFSFNLVIFYKLISVLTHYFDNRNDINNFFIIPVWWILIYFFYSLLLLFCQRTIMLLPPLLERV